MSENKLLAQVKENRANRQAKMSVVGHLQEIKSRAMVALLVFLAATIISFAFMKDLVEVMLAAGEGFNFVYLAPSELLTSYVKLALICGLVIASPVVLYEMWAFVAPALSDKEKRAGFFSLLGGFGFFALGVLFAFLIALPFMIDFFVRFNTSEVISSSISFQNYMNFMIGTMMTFGLVFEMPILALLLSTIGILKPEYMTAARKYAILLIFIIAAIITPPDVVSQVMIGIPMIILYEVSILVCKYVVKRKAAKEAAEEAALENEDWDDDDDDEDEDDEE